MRSFLKPDGVALVAVPVSDVSLPLQPLPLASLALNARDAARAQVGVDAVVWNLHRIYGAVRLPLLLRGWSVLAAAGFEDVVAQPGYYNAQPVMLLATSGLKQGFSWNVPGVMCNEQLRQLRLCALENEQ